MGYVCLSVSNEVTLCKTFLIVIMFVSKIHWEGDKSMNDKTQFWSTFSDYLREQLSVESYNNWVLPTDIIRIGRQSVSISVPNDATKHYWERNLKGYVLEFTFNRFSVEFEPIFVINPIEEMSKTNEAHRRTASPSHMATNSHLNTKYTFENFVVGEGNKMAHGAALAVATTSLDGPKVFNPLLIYGGVGLGKTHLMQAIGNEILRQSPTARVKYTTSESFVNDFVNSIRTGNQEEFREGYRSVDALLIDDIQFLANKEGTQEEFFHTFNALYNDERRIVLTSDRLPNDIENIEERLVSRFAWGLSTDISPPDLETRIAILRNKASAESLDIDPDALTYIASNIDSNVRELEGALMRVNAYSAIYGKEITPSLAAEALHSLLKTSTEQPQVVTPEEVIKKVSKYFDITPDDIKGTKRTRNIVLPRQIGMYLSREIGEYSYPQIGTAFGNKNHTTVMHAYEKIEELLKVDSQIQQDVEELTKQLKN